MAEPLDIIVSPTGQVRCLHTRVAELEPVFGPATGHYRNSVVGCVADLSVSGRQWLRQHRNKQWLNTFSGAWFADCTLVGGPVLGPFTTYAEAIAAEVEWLLDNDLPLPPRKDIEA